MAKKSIEEIESMIDENSIVITLPNGEIRAITARDYEQSQRRIKQLEGGINGMITEWNTIRDYDTLSDLDFEKSIKITGDVRKIIDYFIKDLKALEGKMVSGRINGFYFIKNGKKFVGALRRAADDDPNVSKMFLDNLGDDRIKRLIVANEIEKGKFYNAVAIAFDWPPAPEGKEF